MELKPGKKEFLLWDYVEDVSICDELINFHRDSGNKYAGLVATGHHPDLKDSTDVILDDMNLVKKYMSQFETVVNQYKQKFPFCDYYAPWGLSEPIGITHYAPPDQVFKAWHTERGSNNYPNASRHLVFMTYLNDVHNGGETEWLYQEIKLSPRKGLTAIWPADWTYTHRGVPSKTEHKYIVTGWFSYYSKGNEPANKVLTAPVQHNERP